MNLDAISQVAASEAASIPSVAGPESLPFSQQLQAEFDAVNTKMAAAEVGLQQLAAGKSGDLHHVMLALEDAKLSFQLLVQVRNKVLDAYQEVMRMQV
jgi:flagellar hook-basal body complex protein FliE